MRTLRRAGYAGAWLQVLLLCRIGEVVAAPAPAPAAAAPAWCRDAVPLVRPQQALGIALDPAYAAMFSVGNRFEWQVERHDSTEERDHRSRWAERCEVTSVVVAGERLQAAWTCTAKSKHRGRQMQWTATAKGLIEPHRDGARTDSGIVAMPKPPRAGKGHEAGEGWEEVWKRNATKLKAPTGSRVPAWAYERSWGHGAGTSAALWVVAGTGVVRWRASFGTSDVERTSIDRKLRDCGGPRAASPSP